MNFIDDENAVQDLNMPIEDKMPVNQDVVGPASTLDGMFQAPSSNGGVASPVTPSSAQTQDAAQQNHANLKGKFSGVPDHRHNGNDLSAVKFSEISGFIEVISVVPTSVPRNLFEQIKLYVNGATILL